MVLMKKRTPVDEALQGLLDQITPISEVEEIDVEDADQRVLAEDIISEVNAPSYSRAAMDGYAVRSGDTLGAADAPVQLKIGDRIEDGTCVPVHTGSSMPEGADAVVMLEDTETADDAMVEVKVHVHPGKHVGSIGEDVQKGEKVFSSGHQLRPCDIALLLSINVTHIKVFRKPVVSVIPTGEELVSRNSDKTPEVGEVLETNGLMIGMYARRWNSTVIENEPIKDDSELIANTLLHAAKTSDLVVTAGGTSVGRRDYLPEVLGRIGTLLVHGVAMSPGKPTAIGVVEGKPVICLPGYPVACMISLLTFVKPAIEKIGSTPMKPELTTEAVLTRKITSKAGYRTYTRVSVENGEVTPIMSAGSGILSSLGRSNGLVVVPEDVEGYDQGENVKVIIIE